MLNLETAIHCVTLHVITTVSLLCFGNVQALLKQEVEQLRYQVDHHPDVTKFALENLDLRGVHVNSSPQYLTYTYRVT